MQKDSERKENLHQELDLRSYTHIWVTNRHEPREMSISYIKIIEKHFILNPEHKITLIINHQVPNIGQIRMYAKIWQEKGFQFYLMSYEDDIIPMISSSDSATSKSLLQFIDYELNVENGKGIGAANLIRILAIPGKGIYIDFDVKIYPMVRAKLNLARHIKMSHEHGEAFIFSVKENSKQSIDVNNDLLAFEHAPRFEEIYRTIVLRNYEKYISEFLGIERYFLERKQTGIGETTSISGPSALAATLEEDGYDYRIAPGADVIVGRNKDQWEKMFVPLSKCIEPPFDMGHTKRKDLNIVYFLDRRIYDSMQKKIVKAISHYKVIDRIEEKSSFVSSKAKVIEKIEQAQDIQITSHFLHAVIITELIEATPILKYLYQRTIQPFLTEYEIPESLLFLKENNYLWIGSHFTFGLVTVFSFPYSIEIPTTSKVMFPLLSSVSYTTRLYSNSMYQDVINQRIEKLLQNDEYSSFSICMPEIIISAVGGTITTLASSFFIPGIGIGYASFNIVNTATFTALQCIVSNNKLIEKNASEMTYSEKLIPYIVDTGVFLSLYKQINFDFTNLIDSALSIKKVTATLGIVTIIDQVTQGIVDTLPKKLFEKIDNIITFNWFNEENLMEDGHGEL